jgi:hypothetical protein
MLRYHDVGGKLVEQAEQVPLVEAPVIGEPRTATVQQGLGCEACVATGLHIDDPAESSPETWQDVVRRYTRQSGLVEPSIGYSEITERPQNRIAI